MLEKPIHFMPHAEDQMKERKAAKEEVIETIRTQKWHPAEKGRQTASKTFLFKQEHYGRYYESKEVVPIFIEEESRIAVITVYTFFSQRSPSQ